MNEYLIRDATPADIWFLTEAVVAGEKGQSDISSLSTFFNLPDEKIKSLIASIFEEGIDGCEFSVSSYLVAEYNNEPVAAYGAWIECFNGASPSRLLRTNLIGYTFDKKSIEFLQTKSHLIKDMFFEREPLTLQFEYLYVSDKHRGKGLGQLLLNKLEEKALTSYPELKKAQFQLFNNSVTAYNLHIKHGYRKVKSTKSDNDEILKYLPSNERWLIEKNFK